VRTARRGIVVLAVLIGLLVFAPPVGSGASSTPQPSTEQYGVVRVDNVAITMSDGVQLVADVHYPAVAGTTSRAPGTFPVILAMTPYRKRGSLTVGSGAHPYGGDGYFPYLVRHGYINVIVDVRGTGSSGGQWDIMSAREIQDGVELVKWAASSLSGSNVGINQLRTAAAVGRNSPLKAIFPVVASHDGYRDLLAPGGMWASGFMPQWFGLEISYMVSPDDATAADPLYQTIETVNRSAGAQYIAAWQAEMAAGGARAYDGPFHFNGAPRNHLAKIVQNGIPAFMVGGWFDLFQRGNLLNYSGLQNAAAGRNVTGPMKQTQAVTGRYQMAIGPWYHLEVLEPPLIGDLNALMLRWYDRWLKNVPNGVENTSRPLHLYELRTGRWADTSIFPLVPRMTRHYLAPDGALTTAAPAGGTETIVWEPSAGYCTRSMDQGNAGLIERYRGLYGVHNPCTQDGTASQTGRLTFTSAPYTVDKVLAGPMTATVSATSTATETAWAVTVEVVGADGRSYPVSTGVLMGSHRALDATKSWKDANGKWIIPYHPFTEAAEAPVLPGEVTQYVIEIPSTFARIAAGDSLRVTITPSDEPMATPTAPQLANLPGGVYEIVLGGATPSMLDVPLGDPASFPTSPTVWGTPIEPI
jgi:uncharacterized protein